MPDRKMSEFDRDTRTARNEVLGSGDPEFFSDLSGVTEDMRHVIADVERLIQSLYDFGQNPLMILRKYFVEFEWEYKEFDKIQQMIDHLSEWDYSWLPFMCGDWTQVVSARRKKRPCPSFKFLVTAPVLFRESNVLMKEMGIRILPC